MDSITTGNKFADLEWRYVAVLLATEPCERDFSQLQSPRGLRGCKRLKKVSPKVGTRLTLSKKTDVGSKSGRE